MAVKPEAAGSTDKRPVVIKKYANRRLYNTSTSSYVTLDNLAQMVKDRIEFTVHDAKTGEDLTRSVLTQIIMELEGQGQNLLPIGFLRQLIGFYGDSLQPLVPQYLEVAMHSFTHNQDQIRDYLKDAFGGLFPFNQFEEMSRQNLALFEQTMKMFAPFHGKERGPGGAPSSGERDAMLNELKSQMQAMQRRLDDILPKKGG